MVGESQSGSLPLSIEKVPSGVKGLDEITNGGLPKGRPTLVAGGPGSGKTMFAMEFIARGAAEYGEPGVYMAFEETRADLEKNFRPLGFNLPELASEKKVIIDYVHIERSQIQETGEYDLEALFIRLGYAIDSVGAKRVAIDTLEVLFSGLQNHAILRAELRRLFVWLKEKGVTAVVTAEKGEATVTRYGLEEYVADCVIFMDNRVADQLTTRRLRIIKYRGSAHGLDEYPFLINRNGISIFPITGLHVDYPAPDEYVSSGLERLDAMLGGRGYHLSSNILISGAAGTGKSTLAAEFVNAACSRGERCLYFTFEESQDQILRNMRSVGLNLKQWVDKGLLRFHAARPTLFGLEMHLVMMTDEINAFKPQNIVLDPFSDLVAVGSGREVKSMLIRLLHYLRTAKITVMMTELFHGDLASETPAAYVSSLVDTWILLRNMEYNGERNRGLIVVKSSGMAHSNQIREFRLSHNGIELLDPYIGPAGVLMGSAKMAQETRDKAKAMEISREIDRMQDTLERKRVEMDARIAEIKAAYKAEEDRLQRSIGEKRLDESVVSSERDEMARMRRAD